MSPFLAWGDFHARSRFARSTTPEEKWGTTRSLNDERITCVAWRFWFCAQSNKGGRGQRNRELSTAPDKTAMLLACENIRFYTLFAAGDVSFPRNVPSAEELGETDFSAGYPSSETQWQIVGARESLNGRKNDKMARRKLREEPLRTMSYQTSSERYPPF